MNTFFYTLLEDMDKRSDYSFAKCERIIKRKKIDLKSYDYVLFPINVTSSHWFVAAYQVSISTLHFIDSLVSNFYDSYSDVLIPFLRDYFGIEPAVLINFQTP